MLCQSKCEEKFKGFLHSEITEISFLLTRKYSVFNVIHATFSVYDYHSRISRHSVSPFMIQIFHDPGVLKKIVFTETSKKALKYKVADFNILWTDYVIPRDLYFKSQSYLTSRIGDLFTRNIAKISLKITKL